MPATIFDSSIFRDIFTTPAMREVWSDENRVQKYLDFEAALARAQAKLGIIPKNAAAEIVKHCDVKKMDFAKLKERTEKVGYPVLPVVNQLIALCKNDLGEWAHWGATTQDITDTATVLQIRESLDLIEKDINGCADALAKLAKKHRDTVMVGRSNLQQAVPITFGYKMATHPRRVRAPPRAARANAQTRRSRRIRRRGGHAVLARQGWAARAGRADEGAQARPARHFLAHGARPHRRGRLLPRPRRRHLRQDRVRHQAVDADRGRGGEEPFHAGRGGSSTMPQKRNPISSVYVTAQSAVVKQHVAALLEAMIEDHERSTGQWEIEWIVLPEIFMLTAGALAQTRFVLEGLEVKPDKMRANLDITKGMIMTEAVMMGLGSKLGRNKAHDLLYDIARKAVQSGEHLIDALEADPEIRKHADRKTLKKLVDPANYLGVAGPMVDRVLKGRKKKY